MPYWIIVNFRIEKNSFDQGRDHAPLSFHYIASKIQCTCIYTFYENVSIPFIKLNTIILIARPLLISGLSTNYSLNVMVIFVDDSTVVHYICAIFIRSLNLPLWKFTELPANHSRSVNLYILFVWFDLNIFCKYVIKLYMWIKQHDAYVSLHHKIFSSSELFLSRFVRRPSVRLSIRLFQDFSYFQLTYFKNHLANYNKNLHKS